nr:hypothetical protein [Tanacetum cinerariifolium]
MELYIQGKDHGRIILNSVENSLLVWPTVEQEDGTLRLKTYEELSNKEKLQADCDLKATNIVLQGLEVPTFLPGDDPIACMNKAISFLSAVFTPRYPSTNNQLRSSFNPRNQTTVQDGRVTVQQVQGRQGQNVVGSDPGVADGQVAQTITHNAAFQTDDLDAYDSDCDDISSAKVVLMANLLNCDSDVLYEALSKHVKEKESLLTTLNGFKTKFKERESKSIDKEIVLENKNKELENIVYLKTQIQEKVFVNAALKNKLWKLKGKNVIDTIVSKPYATTIAPGMFKLNLEPLTLKVLKNKDAHLEYIKHFREHADILQEIVESVRALSPLYGNFDLAFVVTPKNKDKKVRFADTITSSSNTQKQVDSHKQKDFNQHVLHYTGVIGSTGASVSKPTDNTKNNRISQSSSSNKTNKVEDRSRSVKSRKNKKNRVAKTECNAYVMQSMLNTTSKSVCAICNECLFDENNDKCVLDYVHDVVQIVLWYLDSRCSKHMTENCSQLTNFINKFLGTVKFGNDQIAKIMGYGDYQIGNVTISRVTTLEGVDLLMRSQGTNLYTLSIGDMMKSSLICLLSKASKTKSWLWHRRLSHLNFGTINQLAKQGLVRVPEVAAPVPTVSTGTPSSILADQDAPSPNVKTAFLNGISREEVYVSQLDRREGKEILMIQIYVDDIIFTSTKPDLCEKNSEIMCSKFKMLMMGKMSFFLGLQISQSPRGIFLNQSKYALEMIKKYGIETSDSVDTPMVEKFKLDTDPQGKEVDPTCFVE